jgi:beta-lactamase regulating signal transducer with metallopeptidase domain
VTVVYAMLGNAAVAGGLALLALAVGFVFRSPAVRHAAWLLVLLKLVTPPLFAVPLPVLPASWGTPPAPPTADQVIRPAPSALDPSRVPTEAAASAPGWWDRYGPAGFVDWLLVMWVVGSVGWFAWQGRRVVGFARRVRRAEDAPAEVIEAAAGIAAALGIARPPAVKVAAGIGSPMLWGWGRATVVLFPRGLLDRLAPEARDTLLAHELAHFLRRDHWVRVLEFVATGLYWWHPAVWLARNGVEAAEEECCDAWVVGGLAASPRRYAEALLATVDYEAELRRPYLPPTACAASRSARLLHRRLLGIIHADRPSQLRGGTVLRVVVLAALLTQPILRAATPEPTETPTDLAAPTIDRAPRPKAARPRPSPKTVEPRSWATAAPAGTTVTVLARDREMILRRADGTDTTLGPGRPIALSFSPDRRRIATAGPGPLVRVWDDRGTPLAEARLLAAARAVAHTPDGNRLLVLDAVGGVSVLDPQTLTRLGGWSLAGVANSIACSPDGRTVAVAFGSWMAETGWVELRSIADGQRVAAYPAPAPVGAVRFTPDGATLVVGGWSGLVVWLALPSGDVIAERQLAKDAVATAAFSPDAASLPLEPPPETAPPPSPVVPNTPDIILQGVSIPSRR